jgi:hypothetical protein
LNYYSPKTTLQKYFWKVNIQPVLIFCVLNLALLFAGIRFNNIEKLEVGSSVLLSYLGIYAERVNFPLSQSINSFANLTGGLFLFLLLRFFLTQSRLVFTLISIFTVVIILLLLDSRVSFFLPVLVFVCLIIYQKTHLDKLLILLPLIIILGPVLFGVFTILFQSSDFAELISRSKNEFETGNSRFVIWLYCIDEFSKFKAIHLIGYGHYGHYGSGVSELWASIFVNSFEKPELKTPHNSLFSLIFDVGYLGVITYLVYLHHFVGSLIKKVKEDNQFILYMSFFMYLLLSGITEANLGFYNLVGFYQILLITTSYIIWNVHHTIYENKTTRNHFPTVA